MIKINNTPAGTVELVAPSSGSSRFAFPTNDGTSGYVLTTDGSGNLSWISAPPATDYVLKAGDTMSGDLNFSGTGRRILANFSTSTVSDRCFFQSNVTNGYTSINAAPNGTNRISAFQAYNTADMNNSSLISLQTTEDSVYLSSGSTGTGTLLPLDFRLSSTQAMRITTAGNILIGTTSLLNFGITTTSGVNFHADGVVASSRANNLSLALQRTGSDGSIATFNRDTTSVGSISVTTTATAYNTSSDYRLKQNVEPIANVMYKVSQLKPCQYQFIADPDNIVTGFLAHELQQIIPQAVTGEKDQIDDDGNPVYQGVDASKIIPLLTAVIQQLMKSNTALEQRVLQLEQSIIK